MKTCTRCKEELDASRFSKKGKNKNGTIKYKGYCKKCESETPKTQRHKTYLESRRQRLRREFDEFKRTLSCNHCQMSFLEKPWLCDFHHLDPSIKDRAGRGISYLVQLNTKERLYKEVEKCIPLCANCHRTLHHSYENKKVFKKANSFKQDVLLVY